MAVLGSLKSGTDYRLRLDYPNAAGGPMIWSLVVLAPGGYAGDGAVAPGGVENISIAAPTPHRVVRLTVDLWEEDAATLSLYDGQGSLLGQWSLVKDGSVAWVSA